MLIARLGEGDEDVRTSLTESLPEARILALHLTDLDADYWTELAAGQMSPLQEGVHSDPHIRITAASDEFIAVVDGRRSVLGAVLTGGIRLDASPADLLRLRKIAG